MPFLDKNRFVFIFITLLGFMLSINSCKKDPINDPGPVDPEVLDCDYQGLDKLVHPDSTLTLEDRHDGVDYIINCRADVEGDLIIEPGVTIQFGTSGALDVMGSLSAVGTPTDSIVFTGEDKVPGAWGFIAFISDDVKNKLDHCVVEYGGGYEYSSNGDEANVFVKSPGGVAIDNSNLRYSKEYGLRIASHDGHLNSFQNNRVTACNIPLFLPTNLVHHVQGGSYTGNNTDAVLISSGGFGNSATISNDVSWDNLDVPYRVGKSLRLTSGTLTLEAGTTIEFENGKYIDVGDSDQAGLHAVGNPSNPILFTGVTKAAGAWGGIIFDDTQNPLNEIGHATIEYGASQNAEGAIYMWGEPVLHVHDVVFKDLLSCVFYAAPSTSNPNTKLTDSNNTYSDNVGGAYKCGD